ncbi:BBP7 family outer membrane beta-barrel protein [Anatilimnocola sp. NA78]|uniref:BBP7 family outer membrane beta-barrel protein n=1 Tax=Anatilimnocola sp. NA78 TaxID=3415683 RepID=UPI003CE4E14F
MTERTKSAGLSSLHCSLLCAVMAVAVSAASAQAQLYSPPRGPANQSRARLASWQETDPNAPMEQAAPGQFQPAEQPQAASRPAPARNGHAQSRLKNPPPFAPQQNFDSGDHQFAAESIDQWVQGDSCNSCGPGGCGPSCGPACGPRCCGPGGCLNCPSPEDPCFQCRPNLWWFKADLMLGFRKGRSYPPLVTTDPSTEDSTTAGVLPGATILYGGDNEGRNTQMQPGASFDFGTWLNDCQTIGFGGRYFFLGDDNGNFSTNSGENSVLAIPFFSLDLGAPSSLLLAHPDVAGEVRTGAVSIVTTNQVYGFDAYARFLYCKTMTGRVDFITGWHTSSVNDYFTLRMQTDGNQPNNDIRLTDQFDTENTFHGVTFGLLTEHQVCCMTLKTRSRVSVGNMHQQVNINGATTVNGVLDQNEPGGLFTAASNIGSYSQDQFAAVSETGITLGYYLNPNVQFTVGYNLMYWSNVVRPGGQIDTVIDDVNPVPTRPAFTNFNTSSFWVQSVNLGLHCEF